MKAILLCAGFATRMYPLTENFPKPLLQVAGQPILSDLVAQLYREGGVKMMIVVSNARFADHFRDWAGMEMVKYSDLTLTILDDSATSNDNRLGAVQDLLFAVQTQNLVEPVVVAGGDNLFRFPMRDWFDDYAHQPRNLICVYHEPDQKKLQRSGVAELAGDQRLLRMIEKPEHPPSHYACPPLYLLQTEALQLLPEFIAAHPHADAPGNFIAWLAARLPVYAHVMAGGRLDIGNLEIYQRAESLLQELEQKRLGGVSQTGGIV